MQENKILSGRKVTAIVDIMNKKIKTNSKFSRCLSIIIPHFVNYVTAIAIIPIPTPTPTVEHHPQFKTSSCCSTILIDFILNPPRLYFSRKL